MRWIVFLCLSAVAASAETCPPVPDSRDRIAAIIAGLQAAESAAEAAVLNRQIWEVWTTAPDARA